MKIDVWLCEKTTGYDWCSAPEKAIIRKRKLSIDGKFYGIVKFDSAFDVSTNTEGRFNVLFEAEESEKVDEWGFYYANVSSWQKIRLNIMFNRYWIQKNENFKWLIGLLGGSLIGYLVRYFTAC
jgi:hypothetical protein